ncbi:MAG: 3D domain-containing protein [Myxococcota bacterium]
MRPATSVLLSLSVFWLPSDPAAANGMDQVRTVNASAYNSVPEQTDDDPWVAAWGDTLEDDMKVIAVSRDLLDEGLTRGVRVQIEGLPGEFTVLDKMAARWSNRIDIYMGGDVDAALDWGVRKVEIRWSDPRP